ncbi:MAG TPA: hypothetical protein VMS14_07515 [Ilumatobacteraceae bacterium]|nr:hypothetical protein [Ilumatobacteraceae bacterium]
MAVDSRAWQEAAMDLGVEVIAPGVIDGFEFVAILPDFGSPGGAAVLTYDDSLRGPAANAAEARGYFVSIVNPQIYRVFQRERFIETLDDWGWFGTENAPEWYGGHDYPRRKG